MILRAAWQSAVLVLMAGAGALGTYWFHPGRPEMYLIAEKAEPGEITAADAMALGKSGGVVWIDARRRSEYEGDHIPGALLLNEYEWDALMPGLLPALEASSEGQPLIIYCDAQKCAASNTIRALLRERVPLGDREILVLHGGWPAWKAAR